MKSALERASSVASPRAMRSRFASFSRSTQVLNEATSSSFEIEWGGVNSPVPEMAMDGMRRLDSGARIRALL